MNALPLLSAPPLGLLRLWGSLVEAVHGVNGFGGDTAEVYAYTLLPDNPTRYAKRHDGRVPDHVTTAEREDAEAAADVLAFVLALFVEEYERTAFVNDIPFPAARVVPQTLHRWHVRICPRKDTPGPAPVTKE